MPDGTVAFNPSSMVGRCVVSGYAYSTGKGLNAQFGTDPEGASSPSHLGTGHICLCVFPTNSPARVE